MSNIRLDLSCPVINGQTLTFRSPVYCSEITGLIVYYPESGSTVSKTFQFSDAHGHYVGGIDLFAEDSLVKVILDTELYLAYVQNADTNSYLEGRFDHLGIESKDHPGCFYRVVDDIIEWINPPMIEGVEYRTTERHSGYPVYLKRVDLSVPEPGESSEVTITSHSDDQGVYICSIDGILLEDRFPDHSFERFPVISSSDGSVQFVATVYSKSDDYSSWILRVHNLSQRSSQDLSAEFIIKYMREE